MFCEIEDVKRAVDFPIESEAPIDDSSIKDFILDSQDEIENLYHTKFYYVSSTSTATDGSTSSLTDTGQNWYLNEWKNKVLYIVSGTGSGQYRKIISNTSTVLTVTPSFDTAPDNTSVYEITTLGYRDETLDGSGNDVLFTKYHPLTSLISLSIDSMTVTPSKVFIKESGKMQLKTTAEVSIFKYSEPQQINVKYIYGVEEPPRIVKRLCVVLSAMRMLSAQIAGTYDDFTSVQLPEFSGSKGEPYTNIRESLSKLQNEAKGIVFGGKSDQVTGDWHNNPVYRPFSHFG